MIREHDLRTSVSKIGQIYPVLVDSEGRILDGNERSETFENWPKRTLENIRTDEQRLLLEVHLNLARRSDRNYNKGLVNKLAQFYLDGGARIRGEVKGRRRENEVMALTIEAFRGALNERSVLRLLEGPDLPERGRRARERVVSQWSNARLADTDRV